MFVFRLIIYMYDRKHSTGPTGVWQTLGYFFLLPNVCFPLFPVVDYKKFTGTTTTPSGTRSIRWVSSGYGAACCSSYSTGWSTTT
jgi:hypothetical protein